MIRIELDLPELIFNLKNLFLGNLIKNNNLKLLT